MAKISFDGINIDVDTIRAKLAQYDSGQTRGSLSGYDPIREPRFFARVSDQIVLINNNPGAVWLQMERNSVFGTSMYIRELKQMIAACKLALDYTKACS